MNCPYCGNKENKVVDKRNNSEETIKRRRQCLKCKKRFSTLERYSNEEPNEGRKNKEVYKNIKKDFEVERLVESGELDSGDVR